MSDVVIRADGLGKRYLIGHQSQSRERYTALRDVVGRNIKSLGRTALDMMKGRQIVAGDEVEEFWALKDVNFEIRSGEVVGIIGRNGAGKSTLLKILSRITEPSIGRVEIKGRVASLLEVGTGFHPELSGRENIYLNGAILGMSRAEIRKKFDEIVAFAEVERFIDTPVKRYSSGMYVRLAFAVAAHLEPEILIVDEVLAVGDAEFQKKCLGKMQGIAGIGRTVMFVSHQLSMVRQLTERCVLLENGRIRIIGETPDVLKTYQKAPNNDLEFLRVSSNYVNIDEVLINGSSDRYQIVPSDGCLCVLVKGRLSKPLRVAVEIDLRTLDGISVGSFMPEHFRNIDIMRSNGPFELEANIKLPKLLTGEVCLSLSLTDPYVVSYCEIDPLVILQTFGPAITSHGSDIQISSGRGPSLLDGQYQWGVL